MHRLLQFGLGAEKYTFTPDDQASIQPRFGDTLPESLRLPGLDGGFNVYGTDRAPSAIGNLQAFFWIIATDNGFSLSQMEAAQHEIFSMLGRGEQPLIKEDQAGLQMWTWATVNNVQMAQNARQRAGKYQQWQINFQAPKSRWYATGGDLINATDSIFEDGLPTPAPKIEQVLVNDGDTVTITNNGNAPAGAYVRWDIPPGASATNPTLTRFNAVGIQQDYIQYLDSVPQNTVIEIDARNAKTMKNFIVTPSYQKLDVKHGRWLEIMPGDNTLHVSGTFGADVRLTVDCWDTYF